MYKMNETLKYIILFLIICSIAFINNRIILWLYLLFISVYNFHKRNKLLSFISIILIIIFVLALNNTLALLFYKILLILDIIYTFYYYFIKDNKNIRRGKKIRTLFYEDNFDKITTAINKKKNLYYSNDIITDDEIERSLERKYLESRIRFYGFNKNSTTKKNDWTKLDLLILLFSFIIFIIIIIIGR